MRVLAPAFGWSGLNTRATATGLPLLDCVHLQDMRVVGRDLVQRKGIVHLLQASHNFKATSLNGSTQEWEVCLDTRVHDLGRQWTLECLFKVDNVTGTQSILAFDHATTWPFRLQMNADTLECKITDSADTVVTLSHTDSGTFSAISGGDTVEVQVIRNGTSLTMNMNGQLAHSTTMADLDTKAPATMFYIGRDETSPNHFPGDICYVRLFSSVRSTKADGHLRLANPRAEDCMMDYDFNESAGGLAYDRSRYQNHAVPVNSPTEVTPLSYDPGLVRTLSMFADKDNRRQLLVASGGNYYLVTI